MEINNVFQPQTLLEAQEILSKYQNCLILAGGTDLILDLKRKHKQGEYLIDLNNITELKAITEKNDEIIIGSMVTFADLLNSKVIQKYFNGLYLAAKTMGSPQIRNMATIGGNIINGAAAADIIPCIICLDGMLEFTSKEVIRYISCEEYFQKIDTEHIKSHEVLTNIIIPKRTVYSGYYKLGKRNSLSIARLNTAISIIMNNDTIQSLAICLGAVGRYPFRVKEIETKAYGKTLEYLYSEEILNNLETIVYESIKTRKTMPFKKEAVKGVYKLALEKALGEVIR